MTQCFLDYTDLHRYKLTVDAIILISDGQRWTKARSEMRHPKAAHTPDDIKADILLLFSSAAIKVGGPRLGRKQLFVKSLLECVVSGRLFYYSWSSQSPDLYQTRLIFLIPCRAAYNRCPTASDEKGRTGNCQILLKCADTAFSARIPPIFLISAGQPADNVDCLLYLFF